MNTFTSSGPIAASGLRLFIAAALVALGGLGFTHSVDAADAVHFLGPTGITGQTSAKRIVVTRVAEGSPAFGKIRPKMVILGVNGMAFEADARREMGLAIDAAESKQADGALALTVKGRADPITLQLTPLGSYAETAPFHCDKTNSLITRVADKLVETGDYKAGRLDVGWLALMATGEDKYIDIVKRDLPKEEWVKPDQAKIDAVIRGDEDMGYVGWNWGYQCIVLGEYQLLTGDKSMLPALRTYAVALAEGQDPAGIWGHRMATERRGGRLPGYSHINQPSLTCFIGMLMARKCGVDDPKLQRAIERTHAFYSRFTDRGAIPYGNHQPYTHIFNNNGTSGSLAVAMSIYGDRQGAAFFSRLAATAYDEMETGHASHYFNILWTPLGAAVTGPQVNQQFFEKTRWFNTIVRTFDNRFTFDGGEAKGGNSSGSHLLAYCLPRRAIYITGKNADDSIWLDADEATAVIHMSKIDYKTKSVDELIGLLDHWAPQVRRRAVWTLREREFTFLDRLDELITKGTKNQKSSAIGFYGYKCPAETAAARLDLLGAILVDDKEDPEIRADAAASLSFLGEPAYKYFDDMLRLLLADEPDDPFQLVDASVGKSLVTLCANPFEAGLVKDKDLFYQATQKLADHGWQSARADAMRLMQGMPLDDFYRVGDTVKRVVLNREASYTSYHNPGSSVLAGALVLKHLNVKEGMEWGWATMDTLDGKGSFKINAVLRILAAYGPHARPYVEKISADPKMLATFSGGRWSKIWKGLVAAAKLEPADKLITFEQAKQAGRDN